MSKTVLSGNECGLTFFGETVCILHPGLWRVLCVLLAPNRELQSRAVAR